MSPSPPHLAPGEAWEGVGTGSWQTRPALPPTVIILSILEAVIILLLIFLRKRILIAIALIKEASRWVPGWPGAGPGRSQGCSGPDACVSALPQGCGIRDVLPAVPTGHLLPAVPLHCLLG